MVTKNFVLRSLSKDEPDIQEHEKERNMALWFQKDPAEGGRERGTSRLTHAAPARAAHQPFHSASTAWEVEGDTTP